MDKVTINGIRYIALGDLEHVCSNLIQDIYDRYEPDERGRRNLSTKDIGMVTACSRVFETIMEDELRTADENADTAEEQRRNEQKVYDRVRGEWECRNYLIKGMDGNEAVYFRKMCPYAPKADEQTDDDDDSTPVFASKLRLAKTWHDHYDATAFCEYLKRRTGLEDLKVIPVWQAAARGSKAFERLCKAIFGEDEDKTVDR